MIDVDKILENASKKGIKISKEEVIEMIEKEKTDDLYNDLVSKYRYEIWDKKSSINDVLAEDIIKSRPYKIDGAYLIYINDKLVYFQDHDPKVEGYQKMTKKKAEETAKKFIDEQIKTNVDIMVFHNILNKLSNKGVMNNG